MTATTPHDAPAVAEDATPHATPLATVAFARDVAVALRAQVAQRVVGQHEAVELLLVALFSNGHALSIGVPGLAKTLLISTLAEAMQLDFGRIQFTPDMMPGDVTGTEVLEEERATGRRVYRFVEGPVFTQILLADELNRTPPKTQAALLQAMQERQVSAGGMTRPLAAPFLVLATQNPIEQHGTYPLPEAQLDRFMLAIHVDYPDFDDELEIVRRTTGGHTAPVRPVLTQDDVLRIQALVREIPVADHLLRTAVTLVRATRPGDPACAEALRPLIAHGASPRASQALILGAKALAVLDGRVTVRADDLARMAVPVLAHRVVPSFRAESEGLSARDLVARVVQATPPT